MRLRKLGAGWLGQALGGTNCSVLVFDGMLLQSVAPSTETPKGCTGDASRSTAAGRAARAMPLSEVLLGLC